MKVEDNPDELSLRIPPDLSLRESWDKLYCEEVSPRLYWEEVSSAAPGLMDRCLEPPDSRELPLRVL